MEKILKFNDLLANCVIFDNAAELTVVLNQLAAEGHPVRGEDVAARSPPNLKLYAGDGSAEPPITS